MFRRPVIAALSLFLALGGVAPAFGRPGGAPRPATRAPAPAAIPPAAPVPTGDAIPPTDPSAALPPGADLFQGDWGFWGPRIRGCESGNGPTGDPDYRALNDRSGASGAYQFLDSTWGGQYGVRKARDASPAEQEMAAYGLFSRSGTAPWSASYLCWHADRPASAANAPLPASSVRPPSPATGAPATGAASARPAPPKPARPAEAQPERSGGNSDNVGGAVAGFLGRRK